MATKRAGRNDPCPCGSGKKYKQCCQQREEAQPARPNVPDESIANALQAALAHHQAGRLAQAETIYRQILQAQPNRPDALHLLGLIAHQVGQNEAAVELIGKAISVSPSAAPAHAGAMHCNLGLALHAQGMLDAAVESYRHALALKPDFAEAHYNLGLTLQVQGRTDAALESYRRVLSLKPDYADAHFNMGVTLQAQGKLDAAIEHYGKTLSLRPGFAEAHYNLGVTLQAQGKPDEAAAHYHQALALNPDFAEAHHNLGTKLLADGESDAAIERYRRALALKPDFAEAHFNLGTALSAQGELDEAVESYRRALAIKPDHADAHYSLGNAFQGQGKLDAAIDHYRQALALKPDFAVAHSNVLFCLNYHPDLSAEDIFAEYRSWNALHARPLLRHDGGHANGRDPARRLRIGYVSPDLRLHSAHHFIEPLLTKCDKAQFEVFAYAEVPVEDDVSARLKGHCDQWRNTVGLSDERMAELIRADGIDILVDLAGHTDANRLLVFAPKPAPVQVSWLGYGYTTGLDAIDYFLADREVAPAGSDSLFAEKLVRLPCWATYRPSAGTGEAGPLPALHTKRISFGSLSRSLRINHRVIRTWAAILNRLPGSRLVINSRDFRFAGMRTSTLQEFATYGIAPERLELGYDSPPWDVLRKIDISLDCFPHNSGTTLFESLYMGVPFVTLAGRPSVGRMGAAILKGLGHPEWIAAAEPDYIDKAVALATDIDRLASLRSSLRKEMEASILMDESAFTRSVEAAYRTMWKRWCCGQAPVGIESAR